MTPIKITGSTNNKPWPWHMQSIVERPTKDKSNSIGETMDPNHKLTVHPNNNPILKIITNYDILVFSQRLNYLNNIS